MGPRIPQRGTNMTSTEYLDRATGWARLLEDREAARSGRSVRAARKAVSRRLAMPEGTLENLRKNRLKAIAAHWYDRLRTGVIAELEAELRHVQEELTIARQTGMDPDAGGPLSLVANEARLRSALGLNAPASANGGAP